MTGFPVIDNIVNSDDFLKRFFKQGINSDTDPYEGGTGDEETFFYEIPKDLSYFCPYNLITRGREGNVSIAISTKPVPVPLKLSDFIISVASADT